MSAKKAEKIIKMRPFDSWNDLVRMLLSTNSMLFPYILSVLHYVHVGLQCAFMNGCQRKSIEKQGSSLKSQGVYNVGYICPEN